MNGVKRTTLTNLFRTGVRAVRGDVAVKSWLSNRDPVAPTKVLAVGKAAVSMFTGLPRDWQCFVPTLLVTKDGHIGSTEFHRNVEAIEASHPVPNEASLHAGQKALSFVDQSQSDDKLLILVSGGASALVEHLQAGVSTEELISLTEASLGDGANIAEINKRRKKISAIKGGKLLSDFKGQSVEVLAISDVCGDGVEIIGSGIGASPQDPAFEYSAHIVASNFVARQAIVNDADAMGLKVITNAETMYDDVRNVAARIASDIQYGPSGLYLYGGEPTVVLPKKPGKGGRNQALALELAKWISKRSDVVGIVAGTDGTDGPTDAAGAYLDGGTFESCPGAEEALETANSAAFLARSGDQIITGPTGTNVMDIAIIIKNSESKPL